MNRILSKSLFALAALGAIGVTILQLRPLWGPGDAAAAMRAETTPPIVGAAAPGASIRAEGRVAAYPGAEVTVGTDLAGVVDRLLVEEKQTVRKGQRIAELRADDLSAELAEARERVAEADADLRLYELEVARAERLVADGVLATQNADLRRRDRDAAQARRKTALASVERLQAVLAKSRIEAPIAGVVTARMVDAGETVDRGVSLVTIADLSRVRVEAEVDEFDVGRVRLGQAVQVTAEGFDGMSWPGRVEEIPDTVSGRRLKPQDPSRPQDTRVLLVKVALDAPTPLKLGQRVEVRIAVDSGADG